MNRLVFEMQQLQRDVLAAFALAVHIEPVGLGSSWSELFFGPREQPNLERSVIDILRQRPAEPRTLRTFQVALHRRRADADALRDLPIAEPLRIQPQDLGDLAH